MLTNRITIIGNIASQLETRGKTVRFRVAVDRRRRNEAGTWEKTGTDFITCVAFNDTATKLAAEYKQGQLVKVTGALRIPTWTDEATQAKRSRAEVHVRGCKTFAFRKKASTAATAA